MLCEWSEVWARGICYWQLCPVADAYNHSRFSQVPMIFVNDLIIIIRLCMMLELLPCMWFFIQLVKIVAHAMIYCLCIDSTRSYARITEIHIML